MDYRIRFLLLKKRQDIIYPSMFGSLTLLTFVMILKSLINVGDILEITLSINPHVSSILILYIFSSVARVDRINTRLKTKVEIKR